MMKKSVVQIGLFLLSLTCLTTVNAQPTENTTSKNIYDFSGFEDVKLLQLFKQALDNGRKFPTKEEFAAAGIQESDLAFVRSHVRKRSILDRTDRVVQKTYKQRELFMNIPAGIGNNGAAGYPSADFNNDVYSMWNYTHLYGAWNHSFFKVPGAWVDAAHKNGTDILSGLNFFDTTGNATEGAVDYLQDVVWKKDEQGNFIYAAPLINCLMYFGSDGINYNWETVGWDQPIVTQFHQALYKEAKKQGFDNFHIMLYNGQSSLLDGEEEVERSFGSKKNGRTFELMLNYTESDFTYGMGIAVRNAKEVFGTSDGLYAAAWLCDMNKCWDKLDYDDEWHQCNLALWGEHKMSRFYQHNYGNNAYELVSNYQALLERAFSGGMRNPVYRPEVRRFGHQMNYTGRLKPLYNFCGLAEFIPERSAIDGTLPFRTGFNIGNGDRYNYKGKKTAEMWYNMANQDIVPTYRWLVLNAGTEEVSRDIEAEFTPMDAYTGGSSLLLTGEATAQGTDIVLYKTRLKVSAGNVIAKLALKSGKAGEHPSNLSLIVRTADNHKWIEVPYGMLNGKDWQAQTLKIPELSTGDVIDRIGLRVKGRDNNFKLYVGELEINDDIRQKPADIRNLTVEVKEETKNSMSFKLYWDVNAKNGTRSDWGIIYNDEANISHFEVLYKDGTNGRVSEIGRTTQWATYVGNKIMKQGEQPYIGVRAVSTDLKTYSPIVWQPVTRTDAHLLPEAASIDLYGNSEIDELTEGVKIARTNRYIEVLKTEGAEQNINYTANTPQADGTQYVKVEGQTLVLRQGQQVKLFFKAADLDDGMKFCLGKGYIDLNGDHMFNGLSLESNAKEGENIFDLGSINTGTSEFQTTGVTVNFTVPKDARRGMSRMRLVFSDAWFSHPGPTGKTNKGFSIDVDVKIVGTNAKERAIPEDLHDQGIAEEPENMEMATNISTPLQQVQKIRTEDGTLHFENMQEAWIYTAEGHFVQHLIHPKQLRTSSLHPGVYLIKMKTGNIIRTTKISI